MKKSKNDKRFKELMAFKGYIFVLASSALSSFGFILFQVVLFWLAYKMSSTPMEAGIVVQSAAVPYLFFGLIGGVYADKWNKKKIILWNQLGTGLMFFTILLMFWMNLDSIWYIAVATFLIVSFRCFYSPAIRSLVSKTLPEELWQKGNSVFQISQQLCRSLAPVLAGVLLTTVSLEMMFLIFLLLTLMPLLFVLHLTIEEKNRSERGVQVFKELKGTFTFLRTSRPLFFSIIAFGFVLLFFTGMERLGLPIVSDTIWQMGSKGFSIILTLFGIGNAFGAVMVGKIELKNRYSSYILIGCVLWGIGLMGVGLSANMYLVFIFAFFTGITESFIDLPMVLMIQKYSPEEKIGQVFSALSTIAFIGEAGSSMLVAFVIQMMGVTSGFVVVAAAIAFICGLTYMLIERGNKKDIVTRMAN